MTTLKERLTEEMRTALKSGEKVRLGALRLLAAAVKNREVELRHDLSDDEVVEVATREAKKRAEAIEAYEAAGRPDRAATEREELAAIAPYLPAQLSEAEIDVLIDDAVASTGASGPGDLGKVMSTVMASAKGRADGASIQAKVRARLGA